MKFLKLLAVMLLTVSMTKAQSDDPVIMKINGNPVTRSEFEYSYNKNNSDDVIDKKTIDEYVDLFVNYKLKVVAAYDAKLDTLSSFKKEFAMYRDQQIRPTFVEDSDVVAEARKVYENTKERIGTKGLIKASHILLYVEQKASKEKLEEARLRADSIYEVLKAGGDFAELAKKYSQDPGSAKNGGELPWLQPGQTLKEFETAAYALQKGEMSRPVLSPVGYHIILMKDRKQFEPFDTLKNDIIKFIEARGVRERIVDKKLDEMAKASDGKLTRDDILSQKAEEMSENDPELKNLIREYHDGLLLYEISNRMVWDKAAKDEEGLKAYFDKNKKRYYWEQPRYKGMVYHVKQKDDVKAVQDCVKDIPFDKWADKLRTTFNNDSVLRIRVEKGIFKEGDNAFIDKMVFKKDTTVTQVKGYPIDAVYGKLLKKKPDSYEDVRGQVTADYQDMLEKQWVAELRKKYSVEVYKDVLETVNKHNK
ncbi:MAG: peptidylprolyl isomerase [Prevotellaceae bacterium]|nr:peptidylprolyl isomerase [Prevotellaceae bacterium]